jgi:hypothetical protein
VTPSSLRTDLQSCLNSLVGYAASRAARRLPPRSGGALPKAVFFETRTALMPRRPIRTADKTYPNWNMAHRMTPSRRPTHWLADCHCHWQPKPRCQCRGSRLPRRAGASGCQWAEAWVAPRESEAPLTLPGPTQARRRVSFARAATGSYRESEPDSEPDPESIAKVGFGRVRVPGFGNGPRVPALGSLHDRRNPTGPLARDQAAAAVRASAGDRPLDTRTHPPPSPPICQGEYLN